jgi:ribosomal protein L16 Arg81 hydroxylase
MPTPTVVGAAGITASVFRCLYCSASFPMLKIPISHESFMATYFEQKPLLCSGAMTDIDVNWQDLDGILQTLEPDPTELQIFLDGQVDPATYTNEWIEFGRSRKRLNKHRFYDLMHHGATLVLNRAEVYMSAAKQLCTQVGQFARQPATGNAYVSFSGKGTFGKHWDTHDVYAVQLIGKKLWQLYPPTQPLPLSHQTSRRMQQECPPVPAFECVLAAGDLLYIPRGWWHQVTPLDTASLHFSVGTYPPSISDYVMWVCSRQLPQLLEARRSCRDTAALSASLDTIMQALNQAVFSAQNTREFLQGIRAQERLTGGLNTELFLADPGKSFTENTRLQLTSAYPVSADATDIAVNGGRLKLSPASHAVIQVLNSQTITDWPALTQQLPHIPPAFLREAVIDLARYELVTILENH